MKSELITLILASASPRRKELLQSTGLSFITKTSDFAEFPEENELPSDYVQRNAVGKARTIAVAESGNSIVLGADTIVVSFDNKILEKPQNKDHAYEMLQALSNKSHEVMTGIALCKSISGEVLISETITTQVHFRKIDKLELMKYIDSGEPFDKAGAYGIQGNAAGFVNSVLGSYTNVVGLPLAQVLEHLKKYAQSLFN